MNSLDEIIGEIEVHSVEGIRRCFENGVDPNVLFRDIPLIYELTSEYLRSPLFSSCVRAFVDYGLKFQDKTLLAVLLNDDKALSEHISVDPSIVFEKYTLRSSFTPLFKATLLHICAEFNHVECAEVLLANGSDVNAKAGIDEYGFGGQTPIFHTVNQIRNNSKQMLDLLLKYKPDLALTLQGLIWGKTYEWETLIPSVNALSYAMMGRLPQMHRNETDIAETVRLLMKHAFNIEVDIPNIPNRYLRQ